MAISRAQLAKELEPGLNALFGIEYDRYEAEHAEIYDTESSDRAFEEEVMLVGFGNAQTKAEGAGVNFDNASEAYTARYTHETIALAFALTEEAMEDNLYDRLGARYTRALARSMAHTKQVKAAATSEQRLQRCLLLAVTAKSFVQLITHWLVAEHSATSHQLLLTSTKHHLRMP